MLSRSFRLVSDEALVPRSGFSAAGFRTDPLNAATLRVTAVAALLVLVAFLPVFVPPAQAQRFDLPARPSEPVLDEAGLMSRAEQQRLAQKLTTYERETSTAIVVVTIPSLDGAPISDYAIELGREWGVGSGNVDNGAVVLISRDDRRMFIATGYGLEGSIPDAVASDLVRNVMRPAFRQGDFYGGIDRATSALMMAARGEYTAAERTSPTPSRDDGSDGKTLFFIIAIIAYFVLTSRRDSGDGDGRKRRRRHGNVFIWGSPGGFGGGSGGGGFGGGGFGGFGGGSFGGGGAGGSW